MKRPGTRAPEVVTLLVGNRGHFDGPSSRNERAREIVGVAATMHYRRTSVHNKCLLQGVQDARTSVYKVKVVKMPARTIDTVGSFPKMCS